jgi:hypothetical protein
MKKLILFLFMISLYAMESNAQDVPNGDFENWTTIGVGPAERPDYWQTTDSFSVNLIPPQHSVTKETSVVYSNTYAMRLTPFTYTIFNVPGVASNGSINTSTLQIIGGSPDTIRHQKLSGWYQFSPVGGDTWSIVVNLFKWNGTTRDTVASGSFVSSTSISTYTNFEVNLSYSSSALPDSALITIYSGPSALGAPHIGTVLLIDSLSFSGIVAGIPEVPSSLDLVHLYPVPAVNELTIKIDLKTIHSSFEVLDLNGKRILIHEMNSKEDKIDISGFSNGNYFYNLLDEKENKIASGKFSVNR